MPIDDDLDALDAPVPGGRRASVVGGTSPEVPPVPDIAPPLLLEPIPEPVVLAIEAPAPEVAPANDPYAWASQAASTLERAGRSFDEVAALPAAADSGAWGPPRTPQPPHEPPRRDVRREPPPRAATPEPLPEAAPPSPPEGGGITGMRLLLGAGALLLVGLAALLVVVALRPNEAPDPILRPVDGPNADLPRYSVPDTPVARPPGSDAAALGAVGDEPPVDLARLEVLTRPPGARVVLDGREAGFTPVTITARPGTHAVRVELEGFTAIERVVQLKAAPSTLELDFEGVLDRGTVRLVATGWDGARLRIDGQVVGTIPTRLDLVRGVHTFELELGDQRIEVRREVVPLRGRLAEIDLATPP